MDSGEWSSDAWASVAELKKAVEYADAAAKKEKAGEEAALDKIERNKPFNPFAPNNRKPKKGE